VCKNIWHSLLCKLISRAIQWDELWKLLSLLLIHISVKITELPECWFFRNLTTFCLLLLMSMSVLY
jgi:hypothetical protein